MRIEFLKQHPINDKTYEVGEKVNIHDPLGQSLEDKGIAKKVTTGNPVSKKLKQSEG